VNFSGSPIARSSTRWIAVSHRIDLDRVRELARAEKPKLIFTGARPIPGCGLRGFAEIAKEVDAVLVRT
jgi:glycine hydroxymethyltransferase